MTNGHLEKFDEKMLTNSIMLTPKFINGGDMDRGFAKFTLLDVESRDTTG